MGVIIVQWSSVAFIVWLNKRTDDNPNFTWLLLKVSVNFAEDFSYCFWLNCLHHWNVFHCRLHVTCVWPQHLCWNVFACDVRTGTWPFFTLFSHGWNIPEIPLSKCVEEDQLNANVALKMMTYLFFPLYSATSIILTIWGQAKTFE